MKRTMILVGILVLGACLNAYAAAIDATLPTITAPAGSRAGDLTADVSTSTSGSGTGENEIVSSDRNTTIHVEYTSNGTVVVSATQTTTVVVKTTSIVNGKEVTSTTTSVQTTKSQFMGGSLKPVSVEGSSTTTGDDGSHSETSSWVKYEYNDNGQLKAASGGSTTSSDSGFDANGQWIGASESSTVENYEVWNGQAILVSSITTGTNYGPSVKETTDPSQRTKTGTFTTTTNYTYELIGGSYQLMQEVATTHTDSLKSETTSQGSSDVTKTVTYTRDLVTGVCTGISQMETGTQTVVNANGGSTTFEIQNYKAVSAYDAEIGWYIKSWSYDWVDTTPPPPARSSDPAIQGTYKLIDGEVYAVSDTIVDTDGEQDGDGKVVKLKCEAGKEAEFEALKQMIAKAGGVLEGYTTFGYYEGSGADTYSSHSFVFQGLGFGEFEKYRGMHHK